MYGDTGDMHEDILKTSYRYSVSELKLDNLDAQDMYYALPSQDSVDP